LIVARLQLDTIDSGGSQDFDPMSGAKSNRHEQSKGQQNDRHSNQILFHVTPPWLENSLGSPSRFPFGSGVPIEILWTITILEFRKFHENENRFFRLLLGIPVPIAYLDEREDHFVYPELFDNKQTRELWIIRSENQFMKGLSTNACFSEPVQNRPGLQARQRTTSLPIRFQRRSNGPSIRHGHRSGLK